VTVLVIGKKKCGVCESAKQKLELMQTPYAFIDAEDVGKLHDGWREDHTVLALAALSYNSNVIPTIVVDGQVFGYAEAMAYLKGLKQ